jgi:Tfp pilus assembly pilus retraction ATPase PilT
MAYLDQFLNVVVANGGSDLHIGEGQPPKMRRHGDVAPIREEPVSREEALTMLSEVCRHYKLLSEAPSDTILTIQYKKTEANSLSRSENTGWPTTKGGPLPDPIQYHTIKTQSHYL